MTIIKYKVLLKYDHKLCSLYRLTEYVFMNKECKARLCRSRYKHCLPVLYQHFLSDKGNMPKLIYNFSYSFQETVENLKLGLTRILLNKMVNRLYLVIHIHDCVVISETTCFEAVARCSTSSVYIIHPRMAQWLRYMKA